jgi:acetyl esterase/lipase
MRTARACGLVALILATGFTSRPARHFTSGAGCPSNPPPPAFNDVPFITSPEQVSLDVWEPSQIGIYPALIYVHGGGWHGLCKESDEFTVNAQSMADAGFVVFAIDFRMACDPSSPPANVSPSLCGVNSPVPVSDVQESVQWVRTNGASYGALTTKLALFGTSSGGNLAFEAAMTATSGTRPDAAAGWSGAPDLTMYHLSNNPSSFYAAAENFVGQPCTHSCPHSWEAASPVNAASTEDPPTYIANGTGERVPLQSAIDLRDALGGAGVPATLCTVALPEHAWAYQNDSCQSDPSTTVFDATLGWIHATLA